MSAMRTPLILYHANCSDGFGAAYCAWRHFGAQAQYEPLAHGDIKSVADLRDRFPDLPGRLVYLLDFAFDPKTMEILFKVAGQTVWLDHHKSSLDAWREAGHLEVAPGRFEEDNQSARRFVRLDLARSGAGLAWRWFFPDDPCPELLTYVEDFDLGHMAKPQSRAFNLALLARTKEGNTFEGWYDIARELGLGQTAAEHSALEAHLAIGQAAGDVQDRLISAMAKDARAIVLPGGARGVSLACPPMLVDDAAQVLLRTQPSPGYFAGWWPGADGRVSCSLRGAPGVDVEAIAKRLGGGGHARSSAFRTSLDRLALWLA